MGIDSESDRAASLVIGPTSQGMVRIYIEADGLELPMDFEPAEALEIANELRAAAERAAATGGDRGGHNGGGGGRRKKANKPKTKHQGGSRGGGFG